VAQKEQAQGTWAKTGAEVSFAREWGGHRFTDDEVAVLLAGETIEFWATSQGGKTYEVFGELAEDTFKGRRFIGFHKRGFGRRDANGNAVPPKSWCHYEFTPDEIDRLMTGEGVESSDFVSSKGNRFQCKVFFKEVKKGQGKKIVPDFEASLDSPPKSWCGVAFSDDQLAALAAGKVIEGRGFTSKKGKKFNASLQWVQEGGHKKLVPSFS